MLNKITFGILLVLTAINIATYVQMKKITGSSVKYQTQSLAGMPCPTDPISECNDPSRFSPSAKYAGHAWTVDAATRDAYSNSFNSQYHPGHKGVFVSKKILNKVFTDDHAATGIVCTFGVDNTNHIGLLVEAGYSDSTELSPPPTSFLNKTGSTVLGFLGINSAEAAPTSQITFTRIYCPPQCPTGNDSLSTSRTNTTTQ